jgi:cell division control protein 24
MTSIANRKKSIISTVGIEQPVANNTLLNKGASESLYQQCSRLRARLLRIPNFDRYFALATPASQSRQSTDPVTQLWDCLALGAPLCALYNMLPIQWIDPSLPVEGNPGPRQITVNYDPATFDASNEKDKKKAIMSFMIKAFDHFPECERFNLTEIAGSRESSDGFTKVCNDDISEPCTSSDPSHRSCDSSPEYWKAFPMTSSRWTISLMLPHSLLPSLPTLWPLMALTLP